MSDTEPPETTRDAAREIPTAAKGLKPPPEFVGEAPDEIPGAPDWANLLFRRVRQEVREEKEMLREVLANQTMQRRQFATFRAEMRGKVASHDVELEEARMLIETNAEQLLDHSSRLTNIERELRELGSDGE